MIATRHGTWPTRAVARSTRDGGVAAPARDRRRRRRPAARRKRGRRGDRHERGADRRLSGELRDRRRRVLDRARPERPPTARCRTTAAAARRAPPRSTVCPAAMLPQRGALSVTVPGAVRSWEDVGAAHGTRGLDELLAPAEALRARRLRDHRRRRELRAAQRSAACAAMPRRRASSSPAGVPRPGDVLRNPDLADTLAAIRRGGADAFYTGEIAERIVRTLNRGGNPMTLDDLAAHRTEPTTPLRSPGTAASCSRTRRTRRERCCCSRGDARRRPRRGGAAVAPSRRRGDEARDRDPRRDVPRSGVRPDGIEERLTPDGAAALRAPIDPERAQPREQRARPRRHGLPVRRRRGRHGRLADREPLHELRLGHRRRRHGDRAAEPRRVLLDAGPATRTRTRAGNVRCTRSRRRCFCATARPSSCSGRWAATGSRRSSCSSCTSSSIAGSTCNRRSTTRGGSTAAISSPNVPTSPTGEMVLVESRMPARDRRRAAAPRPPGRSARAVRERDGARPRDRDRPRARHARRRQRSSRGLARARVLTRTRLTRCRGARVRSRRRAPDVRRPPHA